MRRTVDFLLRKSWRSRSSQCQRWSHYGKRAFSSNEFRAWGSDTSSSTLVLLRHGQSTWNKTPTFTGWCDVPLTNEGITEAKEAGQLMLDRNMGFDVAYTSELQRAKQTCYTTLGVIDDSVPVVEAWQLNERHYGALQGRPKDDPTLITEYGEDQLKSWRRDFDQRPPAMDPDHPYFQNPPAPVTESLADCQERVVQYWDDNIVPELSNGSRVLLVAHANTIRALVSFLDNTRPENIPHIHIANSVPCVYRIDRATGNATHLFDKTEDASKGHWLLSTDNQQRLLSKLGGNSDGFARSVFDAWDTNGDGVLSKEELIEGLSQWKRTKDLALKVLAGKLWEDLINEAGSGSITVEKFQSYAIKSSQKHNLPFFLSEHA